MLMLLSSIPEFQHKEHREWLSKIDFYQDQIGIMQKELSLALHQHADLYSIIEHVDEYRNILLKKLTKLDELRRQIILHEKNIIKRHDQPTVDIWDHLEVRKRMEEFEKNYALLKQNIRKYVVHHLE